MPPLCGCFPQSLWCACIVTLTFHENSLICQPTALPLVLRPSLALVGTLFGCNTVAIAFSRIGQALIEAKVGCVRFHVLDSNPFG